MEFIDYYKILGVPRSATAEQITKAYKRLARKYHPDLNKAAGAEAKFKELNEAHEVLKNPETRQRYDTLGANWKHGTPFQPPPGWAGGRGARVNVDLGGGGFSDFFESIFGGVGGGRPGRGRINLEDLFGGGGFSGVERQPRRGGDVESEITVTLDDAYHGNKRAIELEGPQGRRRYDITIPRGVADGETIRLAGQGQTGAGGAGDLYLTVRLAPHPVFRREGDDLFVSVPVLAWDAALGMKLAVPTLDGTAHTQLPPGKSSGQRLRLRGKGMPKRKGGHGDLYAELVLTVPAQLSAEQRELFEALRKATA